jgi:hypothetical protein
MRETDQVETGMFNPRAIDAGAVTIGLLDPLRHILVRQVVNARAGVVNDMQRPIRPRRDVGRYRGA